MAKQLHPFKQWRLENGLTLHDCAATLGISWAHLSRIEHASRVPAVALIARMEAATGGTVTQEEILRFATGKVTVEGE